MTLRLDSGDADFEQRLALFLDARRGGGDDVREAVSTILADVRARGDAALVELTARFDGLEVAAADLRVADDELAAAAD